MAVVLGPQCHYTWLPQGRQSINSEAAVVLSDTLHMGASDRKIGRLNQKKLKVLGLAVVVRNDAEPGGWWWWCAACVVDGGTARRTRRCCRPCRAGRSASSARPRPRAAATPRQGRSRTSPQPQTSSYDRQTTPPPNRSFSDRLPTLLKKIRRTSFRSPGSFTVQCSHLHYSEVSLKFVATAGDEHPFAPRQFALRQFCATVSRESFVLKSSVKGVARGQNFAAVSFFFKNIKTSCKSMQTSLAFLSIQ